MAFPRGITLQQNTRLVSQNQQNSQERQWLCISTVSRKTIATRSTAASDIVGNSDSAIKETTVAAMTISRVTVVATTSTRPEARLHHSSE
jgi:hypothetical protein